MALLTSSLQNNVEKKYNRFIPWLVCLSGGLLFFYEFLQLNVFNSLNTSLMRSFGLNAHMLGEMSSAYFYANAGFLFLAGNLLDRFSTRKLIIFAMIACTAGTIGFAMSDTFWQAFSSRFLVGIGAAFCFLSGVRLASRWFPAKRMALLTGLLVTMAMMGGLAAQAPMTALVKIMPWRDAMLLNGILGIAITVWIYFVVQNRPDGEEELAMQEKSALKQQGLSNSIKRVLGNKQNWKAAFYTCLMNLPIFLLGALWGSMYFIQVRHFSATSATTITGMLFIGTIIGSPAVGIISDRIQNRRIPMVIGAIASFALMLVFIYDPRLSFDQLLLMFLALGFATSTQVISYPIVAESNQHSLTATSVSIVSGTLILGGAIMQPFSGWLLDLGWKGKILDGVHSYNLQAYQHAMLIMLVSFAISIVLAFFVRETHCKPFHEPHAKNVAELNSQE